MSIIPFSDEVEKGSSISSKREDQALVDLSVDKSLDLDKAINEFVDFISPPTTKSPSSVYRSYAMPAPVSPDVTNIDDDDPEKPPSSDPQIDADGLPNLITETCGIAYDIRKFLPFWLKVEDKNEDTLFVKFLQYYYNWLYCDAASGAKYKVDTIDRIQDIEFMDQTTAESFINSFVDGLVNLNLLSIDSTKTLIKNIKERLYGRKTTPEAISRFFTALFDKVTGVQVQEPKTEMLRLNLGNIAFNTGSSGGFFGSEASENSLLNYGRMTDRFFNDFTYTINLLTEQAEDIPVQADYEASYYNILHPIGTRVFFQTTIDDYDPAIIGATFDNLDPRFYENPQIGNYVVFKMDAITGPDAIAGCSGTPNPSGITGNTYDMPSFVHPNWTLGISGETPIGDIKVFDFLYLPLNIDGITTPNIGITSCDNLCAADGNCT